MSGLLERARRLAPAGGEASLLQDGRVALTILRQGVVTAELCPDDLTMSQAWASLIPPPSVREPQDTGRRAEPHHGHGIGSLNSGLGDR